MDHLGMKEEGFSMGKQQGEHGRIVEGYRRNGSARVESREIMEELKGYGLAQRE